MFERGESLAICMKLYKWNWIFLSQSEQSIPKKTNRLTWDTKNLRPASLESDRRGGNRVNKRIIGVIDQKSTCMGILSQGIILKLRVCPLSSNGHMGAWSTADSACAASGGDRVVKGASTTVLPGDTLALRGLSSRVTNVNTLVQRAGANVILVAVHRSGVLVCVSVIWNQCIQRR